MPSQNWSKDQIKVPQVWRMAMMLGADRVDVALCSTVEDHALMHRALPLQPAGTPDPLGRHSGYTLAFEDLIYENPLLLSDFGSIDILVDFPTCTMVPAGTDDALAQDIALAVWHSHDHSPLLIPIDGAEDQLLLNIDTSLLAFLHRTFPEARISHPLVAYADYCRKNMPAGAKACVFAHPDGQSTMVAACAGDTIVRLNAYSTPTPEDAAYYIVAAANAVAAHDPECGLPSVVLSGTDQARQQLEPILSPFAPYLAPLDSPATLLRAATEAADVPFPLLIARD